MLAGFHACQHSHAPMHKDMDMAVSFRCLSARLGACFTVAFCMGLLLSAPLAAAQADTVVLPPSGVKTPYSPLAIPTRLARLDQSLEQLLDKHYHIVAAHPANGEEVLFLSHSGRQGEADNAVICALTIPDPATDQTIPTSRCWALNQPARK